MKATGEQSTVLSFLGFSRNVFGQKLLVYHILILIHRVSNSTLKGERTLKFWIRLLDYCVFLPLSPPSLLLFFSERKSKNTDTNTTAITTSTTAVADAANTTITICCYCLYYWSHCTTAITVFAVTTTFAASTATANYYHYYYLYNQYNFSSTACHKASS